MKKSKLHVATMVLAASAGFISANAQAVDFSIYGQAGLFGFGGGVGIGFNDMLQARIGYGAYSFSIDDVEVESDDETEEGQLVFDADIDWGSSTALIDFYPFSGTFHLTAGLALNKNSIELTGKPNGGVYTINGNDYTASQIGSLKGEADWGSNAPYVGIGWGRNVAKDGHFSFNFDLGVILTGEPDVSLSSSCNASGAACAQLRADIAQEEKDAEEELSDADMIPVINFSIGYRF